jgi:hypothetical protein
MDLTTLLANATPDTIISLDYVAGRPPGEIARQEFEQASDWNKRSTSFIGNFSSLRRTKKGDLLLTLFVHNRGETGAYRAFNPLLGTLRNIQIVSP